MKLPIIGFLRKLPRRLDAIEARLDTLVHTNNDLSSREILMEQSLQEMQDTAARFASQLSSIKARTLNPPATPTTKEPLQAEDNFFDDYYKKFEDRFRGDELTISKRLKVSYGKFFRELPAHIKKRTVVDVGCGRGELLGLLKAEGLHSIGIDLNAEMVRSAQESGYEAVCTDALEHIGGCADASLGGIVGIHIAEHLPFETLYRLISESRRALARDGFLILETPNPENITVGAHTFWFDSSHIKPLPPQVLAFMVEYAGFSSVTIKRMRPIDARAKIQASVSEPRLATFLNDSMFGPVDYAIIARP